MRQVLSRLVFERDKPRPHKDEQKDQRDHDIVMKAATILRPEKIAFENSSNARHALISLAVPNGWRQKFCCWLLATSRSTAGRVSTPEASTNKKESRIPEFL